ncbi:MAG: DUF4214 domain-containing protein [Actinomycetota bacterium]
MGAAALFRRRTLPLSLLVAAGVVAVAGLVLIRGVHPGTLQSEVLGSEDVLSLVVPLEPGWQVPDLTDLALHDHGGHGTVMVDRAVGTATLGAAASVTEGATVALINTDGPGTFAVRAQTAGVWSAWQRLTVSDHESPDGLAGEEGSATTAPVLGPLWLGRDAGRIEVVVVGGQATTAELIFVSPGDRDGDPDGDADDDAVFEPASASVGGGSVAMPAIFGREQWATGTWNYQSDSCSDGPSTADHLQAMVLHHTVTANSYSEADVDDIIRAIYYGHVVVNGWCDIGYNFIVDRFGRIWEARTDSLDRPVIGGHSRGFNTGTVGVALLGQHHPGTSPTAQAPSSAAAAAVESLAHWKLGIHGVDPGGHTWLRNRSSRQPLRLAGESWHYVPTVLGHRDLGVTSCPGNHGYDLLDDLPGALAARRDVSLPYTFDRWQAHTHGPGLAIAEATGGLRPAGAAAPWTAAPPALSGADPVLAVGGSGDGGYLLRAGGSLVEFGAAPPIGDVPAAGAIAVDLQVRSDRSSGWVLDSGGTLHGFGGVGDLTPDLAAAGGPISAVAVSVDDIGVGYVADVAGRSFPVGGAPEVSFGSTMVAGAAAVDIDVTGSGTGIAGWLLDDRGFVHRFGPGVAPGQTAHRVFPPEAVRAVVAAENGTGGWVLDADGQLWPFGGARYVLPVATDFSTPDAVDADHVGVFYQPEFLNGDDARFVSAIHRLFNGQDPSVVTLDLDVTRLEQGSDRVDLTAAMARSDHWSGSSLDQMYRDVLGREPDAEGRAYWLGEVAAGLNLQDLGTYFYGSQEYAGAAGSTEAYVVGLYRALLGREPDNEGLTYWTDLLDSGSAAPPDVANGFYASVESRRDRAAALYQRILGTPPADEVRDYWADKLLAVGDAGVAAELAATSDYYDLAAAGGTP